VRFAPQRRAIPDRPESSETSPRGRDLELTWIYYTALNVKQINKPNDTGKNPIDTT
jgi:hypothetical protein